ncbi:hypothetical protein MYSTI_05821 [Myxococcus stipitatus DSM 14675]|uniref:YdhG-like domain-containing protein n=1 Tax=Myxococcus stipitatus (strain DSM 14675 / JCM 12634 / Mx s8) TaxID=1278073 RepID=L7UHQ7_MYXSD|nr:DUF1801 domain-containing protein [Myxococcus stipitatus]AGC47097.1 hypothetical protein MYSTI_05821 [Myxococcus stipitatus DSM 14675]
MATAKKAAPRKTATKKAPAAKKAVATKKAPVAKKVAATKNAAAPVSQGAVVEAFIGKLESWQQALVRELAALFAAEAPKASTYVKWGHPIWDHAGPFVLVKPAKAHVLIGFWRGGQMKDAEGILEGEGTGMKYLRLQSGQRPPASLAALVRQALVLNEKHGDPMKR